MSFGWGMSDIYLCGRLAKTIYDHFKEGPGLSAEFAADLRLFACLLERTAWFMGHTHDFLTPYTRGAVQDLFSDCWKFMWTHLLEQRPPVTANSKATGPAEARASDSYLSAASMKDQHASPRIRWSSLEEHIKQAHTRLKQAKDVSKLVKAGEKLRSLSQKLLAFTISWLP